MPPQVHRSPLARGLSSIELLLVVAIAAILAVLAVREIGAYKRRARHHEAVTNLGELFNATAAYFHERRPDYAGDGQLAQAPHRCPHPPGQPAGGESGWTPALQVRCSDGHGGACTPGERDAPGSYLLTAWTNNPLWIALGFVKTSPHFHHYNIVTENADPDGHGVCRFTIEARGDDEREVCNYFRRDGVATAEGVVAGALQACPDAMSR